MRHNISQVSYLIGQFNSLINAFGQKPEQVDYFKTQSQGIVNLGQIQQEDLNFVYKVLGMTNTSNVKWSITMPRLQQFIMTMNYMISCDVDVQRQRCILQLIQQGKIDNTVAEFVDELYDGRLLGGDFDIEKLKSNKFGTFGVINTASKKSKGVVTSRNRSKVNDLKDDNVGRNTDNSDQRQKQDQSCESNQKAKTSGIVDNTQLSREDMIEKLINAKVQAFKTSENPCIPIIDALCEMGLSATALILLDDVKAPSDRKIRIRNYDAACQCDPTYYEVSITQMVGLDLRYPKTYKSNMLKQIDKGEYYIEEYIKEMKQTFGVKDSTTRWMQCDKALLQKTLELLFDANIRITEIGRK